MTLIIDFASSPDPAALDAAVERYGAARNPGALTGAGISVESGIPDFRSPGGLWERFPAHDYASFDTFISDPDRSWILFRAMADSVLGAEPNEAHKALADLEARAGLLGVVTQNIDNLHQDGGSRQVIEIHGNTSRLQCVNCSRLFGHDAVTVPLDRAPGCPECGRALKPHVVLFGEPIHAALDIQRFVGSLDLLLVVGTSASVFPAAAIPEMIRAMGGTLIEFNLEATPLTVTGGEDQILVKGPAGITLPAFVKAVLNL